MHISSMIFDGAKDILMLITMQQKNEKNIFEEVIQNLKFVGNILDVKHDFF